MKAKNGKSNGRNFTLQVGRALRRAGLAARKTARAYGTPIYIWRAGKVVAKNLEPAGMREAAPHDMVELKTGN